MRTPHVTSLTLPLLLAFTSCGSIEVDETHERAPEPAQATETAEEEPKALDPHEMEKLEHELRVAQTKLEIARLEMQNSMVQQEQENPQ